MSNDSRIPPVTIVIPCYNRASLIEIAIESAIQNGDGSNIIVVDDGSTDNSWEMIEKFSGHISKFRIKNGGVSTARNFGVMQSQTKYIKFLDSDDLLPTGAISALLEAQSRLEPNLIAFGDARSIDISGKAIEAFGYGYDQLATTGDLSRKALLSGTMSPYLPLYPVTALQKVGGFNPKYSLGEDQELAIRMVLSGFRFYRIPFVVAEVREHSEDRLSRTGAIALYERHAALFSGIVNLFEKSSDPLTPDEAQALAKTIWTIARDAARSKFKDPSKHLFEISKSLTNSLAIAPYPLRPLYRLIDPYNAEQLISFVKQFYRYAYRSHAKHD